MIGVESGKHFACAAFVVTIIPSPLQRLHGFGYNGIVRIHLSTWLVLQLEGSVYSVPRDVTLPSLDTFQVKPAMPYMAGVVLSALARPLARPHQLQALAAADACAEDDLVGIGGWAITSSQVVWFAETWNMRDIRAVWPCLVKPASHVSRRWHS